MDRDSIAYLSGYIKVTKEIRQKIEKHAKRYGIKAEICAWYQDWKDFCSDWCSKNIGYKKKQRRVNYCMVVLGNLCIYLMNWALCVL